MPASSDLPTSSDAAPTVVAVGDVAAVAEPENHLLLRALIAGTDTAGDLSVTWVQLAGRHRRLRTANSTRVYLVVSGAIELQVGAAPPVTVAAGELAVVPRSSPYALEGIGTYLVINGPAFSDGDDEYIDDDGQEPAQ